MPATTTKRIQWRSASGIELMAELRGDLDQTTAPVLFLPGLDLGLDWAFYPYLLHKIAEQRPVLCVTLPEHCPLSRELELSEALVQALERGDLPPGAAWKRGGVGLLGHAKGASLALLVAARQDAVAAIVAIATMCTFNRAEPQADVRVRKDVAQHGERFQLEMAARQVRCPIVLVHGEEDHLAPFDEGELVYHWLPKDKSSLVLLEKTGHSLGAKHPFDGTNKELDRTVRIARELFEREL